MNHYLYRVEDQQTGEYYIGVRSCWCAPEKDVDYKGSGLLLRQKIRGRWSRYRKSILDIAADRDEALAIEALLVSDARLQDPLCLNLARGGRAGEPGKAKSEEHRKRIAQSLAGRTGTATKGFKGRKHTDETRRRMADARRGQTHSPETRAKIAASQKARWARRMNSK